MSENELIFYFELNEIAYNKNYPWYNDVSKYRIKVGSKNDCHNYYTNLKFSESEWTQIIDETAIDSDEESIFDEEIQEVVHPPPRRENEAVIYDHIMLALEREKIEVSYDDYSEDYAEHYENRDTFDPESEEDLGRLRLAFEKHFSEYKNDEEIPKPLEIYKSKYEIPVTTLAYIKKYQDVKELYAVFLFRSGCCSKYQLPKRIYQTLEHAVNLYWKIYNKEIECYSNALKNTGSYCGGPRLSSPGIYKFVYDQETDSYITDGIKISPS